MMAGPGHDVVGRKSSRTISAASLRPPDMRTLVAALHGVVTASTAGRRPARLIQTGHRSTTSLVLHQNAKNRWRWRLQIQT
jgi:hypothetical protein